MGDLAVDHRVVVDHRNRPLTRVLEAANDGLQSGSQRCVVVDPGIPGHSRLRTGCSRRFLLRPVGVGADDDRPGTDDRALRIGRPVGVAVGERHAAIKAGRLTVVEGAPGSIQDVRRRDAQVVDAVLGPQRPQLRPRREGLGRAHATSVRADVATVAGTQPARQCCESGTSPASTSRRTTCSERTSNTTPCESAPNTCVTTQPAQASVCCITQSSHEITMGPL